MNLRRIAVLLGKELTQGSKSFVFVMAILAPLVLWLVVSLVFGSLFSGKPKLGIADEGRSSIVAQAESLDSLTLKEFDTADALKEAVGTGAVDVGIILPAGFDQLVRTGEAATFTAYVWGESLLKNRAILGTTVAFFLRDLSGLKAPVEIVTATLGEETGIPWEDRLLPFIVLMAIVFGGSLTPSTSLVEEKQNGTLGALVVTPTSLVDVFSAKGLLGLLIGLTMGLVILLLNQSFGAQTGLLVMVLALGALMAAAFGVLLGAFFKDLDTLFATIKGIAILLYVPALVYLFPAIPQWIGRIFPTYYFVAPIVEITQHSATWTEVAPEVIVLVGLDLALLVAVALVARKQSRQAI